MKSSFGQRTYVQLLLGAQTFLRMFCGFLPGKERREYELKHWPLEKNPLKGRVWAFHVSSEGELEQMEPLIEKVLERGDSLELVFTSSSVGKKVQEKVAQNPQKMVGYPLPLLTYNPSLGRSFLSYTKAQGLILCRYDFYPELLSFGLSGRGPLLVISGTVFRGEEKGSVAHWRTLYSQFLYSFFDGILPSTQRDLEFFQQKKLPLLLPVPSDFRPLRIQRRLENQNLLLPFLKERDPSKTLVMGNLWAEDLPLLESDALWEKIKKENYLLILVPHLLEKFKGEGTETPAALTQAVKSLAERRGAELWEINSETPLTPETQGSVILLGLKGRLLSLYSQAHYAYVGGGFGRSIHSLFEPYFAGVQRIYFGPRFHRSTEAFFLKEQDHDGVLRGLERAEDFSELFLRDLEMPRAPRQKEWEGLRLEEEKLNSLLQKMDQHLQMH